MATTAETYRNQGRNPRYTTKLATFQNGMYLTEQVLPEGYAKVMINYDIDDTGSSIRPKRGREKVQVLDYNSTILGPVTLTDYIYAYNNDANEVEDTKDLVMSYGLFSKLSDVVTLDSRTPDSYLYVCSMDRNIDTTYYTDTEDQGWIPSIPGEQTKDTLDEFWAIAYDKQNEYFKKVDNENVGYAKARVIENAYAFGKPFKGVVGRPVGTILNSELITFAGSKLTYNGYPNTPERNELLGYNATELAKLILINRPNGTAISRKVIYPKNLNPIEAYSMGFNILNGEPYRFANERGGALSVLGAITYTDQTNYMPILAPKAGDKVFLAIYYQYPVDATVNIKYKIETLDLTISASDWVTLKDFGDPIQPTEAEPIWYEYLLESELQQVRITLRRDDDKTTETVYSLPIGSIDNNNYDNFEEKKFDLGTCKGMVSWMSCLGVYGVTNAPNVIFFSDAEDPSYFPFPYNLLQFDNEILAVHNYLDNLLVITVDSVWIVTIGSSIMNSTQKKILDNVHIPEIDAINLVVLKDQIFFKTDYEFYVLKPSNYTSDVTDLKNYTNSTAIANYTKNFQDATVKMLNKIYVELWQDLTNTHRKQIRFEDFDVLDTRSVVRNEEVHYIYTITPILTDKITLGNLNLHLVYNTVARTWRLYFTAIGNDSVYYAPIYYRNKQSGEMYEFFPYSKDEGSSLVISKQTYNLVDENLTNGNWDLTKTYNNFPYIDTGSISLDDTFTKRFREVQFNLLNREPKMIKFFADFAIDGHERVHATRYELNHITDVDDPEYGKIWITPIETTNLDLVGETILADNVIEEDYWALDLSKFPDLAVNTVRFQLQGRGRRGSLQLLNTSLQRYDLSDVTWVYRMMNAR